MSNLRIRVLFCAIFFGIVAVSIQSQIRTIHKYGVTNGKVIGEIYNDPLEYSSCFYICLKDDNCDLVVYTPDRICMKKKLTTVINSENPLILYGNKSYFTILREENDNWIILFRSSANTNTRLFDLWKSTNSLNSYNADLQTSNPSHKGVFKSKMIDDEVEWKKVKKIRVSVYENNVEKAFVVFNSTNSDKMNWLDIDKIIASSYTDLLQSPKPTTNYFSIDGDNASDRRFYMNANWGGCGVDKGWLTVFEGSPSTVPCSYEILSGHTFPIFVYSAKNVMVNYATEARLGDVFMISAQIM
ncbi:DgyrCDS8557 [Dimorphilus gyrociliatus]|uniref:DgyrCDS8557 n=1 Tax=Dimorphilus gyrociliatus TaxID=2664684 RepID=A0A7I8VUQ4_9ANNE|nr:DgyrCDS8557 [Dimorphilus gyrociliatus]